jgi:surface polysaccharide O-acyltransferase-like enzyme
MRPAGLAAAEASPRLAYIDNLRIAVVAIVVVHHAAQAYGNGGAGWAFPNPEQAIILTPFLAVNAAFGMGLMFLLAGYFVPRAYEHRGAYGFLRERSLRLGAPLLLVSLGVMLPYRYLTQSPALPFGALLVAYLRRPEVGHMWFASLLLVCVWGYAGWRWLRGSGAAMPPGHAAPPGHATIIGFAVWLGSTTFLVRFVYPSERWISPAPFLWIDPARLPQYISLFVLGCAASRYDWFERLPARTGALWLRIGLGAATIPYAATLLGERAPLMLPNTPRSGLVLDAALWAIIESLVCVGLSLGLLVLFRERLSYRSALLCRLSGASYAVYVVHLLPVLVLQLMLDGAPLAPLAKFLIVALLALPASFALASALRKVPGLAHILS